MASAKPLFANGVAFTGARGEGLDLSFLGHNSTYVRDQGPSEASAPPATLVPTFLRPHANTEGLSDALEGRT